MVLQTEYNVKKPFLIRRMNFRKPGLKKGVKKDMKQARDLENRAAHPNTNSEDYAPSLPMGKWMSCYWMFLWLPSFFRLKRHCGAIAERRLDRKGLIIFLFFKFLWNQITYMWQWLQWQFCNLVFITVKFVTGSRNSYWLYRHLTQLRSAFGNITLYNFNIPFRSFF